MCQTYVLLLLSSIFLIHCNSMNKDNTYKAHATIQPTSLAEMPMTGFVEFKQEKSDRVKVEVKMIGLLPNTRMGFHVHEFGDCRNDGNNAGGHYNPLNQDHGGASSSVRHRGDLGNLSVNDRGEVNASIVVPGTVKEFVNRAVIIHQNEDDLKTQPTGQAGARIGCGVLR